MSANRDELKRAAALAALDRIETGSIIGVGTGSTANHFIEALAGIRHRIDAAVASSAATEHLLLEGGVRVVELAEVDRLAVYVDGADEATRQRQLIKGGGGALTREKIVAASSDSFVCIVDASKLVDRLGRFPLPIEVIPMAVHHVAKQVERLGGRPIVRAGFTTDNGNPILDVHDLSIDDPEGLESKLNQIVGVVTNGLFCIRPADLLIVAGEGGVETFD